MYNVRLALTPGLDAIAREDELLYIVLIMILY